LFGAEDRNYIATFFLTNIPIILFYIFIVPFFNDRGNYEHLYIMIILHFLVMLFYFIMGFHDPGIVPKLSEKYETSKELTQIP